MMAHGRSWGHLEGTGLAPEGDRHVTSPVLTRPHLEIVTILRKSLEHTERSTASLYTARAFFLGPNWHVSESVRVIFLGVVAGTRRGLCVAVWPLSDIPRRRPINLWHTVAWRERTKIGARQPPSTSLWSC